MRGSGASSGTGTVVACALLACAGLVGLPGLVVAQRGPMGQGEASINVRSDVSLALRGTNGTTKARLEQLSGVVTGRMDQVRGCYRKLVAKRSTTVGAFRVTIGLAKGKGIKFSVEEKGGSDDELRACVLRVLRKAPFRTVERPAAAVVTLTFDNTRAQGQAELVRRMSEQDKVDVQVSPDGESSADWKNSDGKVAFHVTARGGNAAQVVTATLRGLRDGFATFLDCRRRSDKDGMSPAGTIDVELRLPRRGGKAKMKLKQVTVPHKRATTCNQRAFRRTKFGPAPPAAKAQVRITFAP